MPGQKVNNPISTTIVDFDEVRVMRKKLFKELNTNDYGNEINGRK